jgi:methyltransferase (TIGR00027 family)
MSERREDTSPQSLAGIEATSLVVAAARAAEHRRQDRLFEDPFAELFLRAADRLAGNGESVVGRAAAFLREFGDQPAVRTAYLDRHLLRAAAGGCRQVVLLASGMDTRAFRLDWPDGTRVFDLDLPQVLDFRRHVLAQAGAAPRCDHRPVAVDLRDDWGAALTAAGFSPDEPTAWLAEGILYALPAEAAELLLERVTALSAAGSTFAADYFERSEALLAVTRIVSPDWVRLWESGPAGSTGAWLARFGWQPDVRDLVEAADGYGRPVPGLFDATRSGNGGSWLVTAGR